MASLPNVSLKLFATPGPSSLRCAFRAHLSRSYTSVKEGAEVSVDIATAHNSLEDEERARVNKLRNVSRLPENIYRLYHGQAPELPYKDLHRRKMLYAQLGAASGEDPRLLWPTRAKLLDLEQEEIEEGCPLHERLAKLETDNMAAEKAKQERRTLITKNMQQMPKWIEEYRNKGLAVERAAKERAAKKELLLQEAREHYGYKVQANDPKFHQLVEEKEQQERDEKKKRKKEDKLKRSELRQQQLGQAKTS